MNGGVATTNIDDVETPSVSETVENFVNDPLYLEHSLQGNGFSPEWVLRSALRLPVSENALKYSLQVNGFSLEFQKHASQVNGFSHEWVLRWALTLPVSEND